MCKRYSFNVVHKLILTSAVSVTVLLLHLPSVAGSPLLVDCGVVWVVPEVSTALDQSFLKKLHNKELCLTNRYFIRQESRDLSPKGSGNS